MHKMIRHPLFTGITIGLFFYSIYRFSLRETMWSLFCFGFATVLFSLITWSFGKRQNDIARALKVYAFEDNFGYTRRISPRHALIHGNSNVRAKGLIHNVHRHRVYRHVLYNESIAIYSYFYMVGALTTQHSREWIVAAVPYEGKIQQSILDNKKNNVFMISNLPWTYKKRHWQLSEELSSGDFIVYVQPNQEADQHLRALVESLQSLDAVFDIELTQSHILIYQGGQISKMKVDDMKNIVDRLRRIVKSIG